MSVSQTSRCRGWSTVSMCVHACVCACMRVCVCVCARARARVCVRVCVCTRAHECVGARARIYDHPFPPHHHTGANTTRTLSGRSSVRSSVKRGSSPRSVATPGNAVSTTALASPPPGGWVCRVWRNPEFCKLRRLNAECYCWVEVEMELPVFHVET